MDDKMHEAAFQAWMAEEVAPNLTRRMAVSMAHGDVVIGMLEEAFEGGVAAALEYWAETFETEQRDFARRIPAALNATADIPTQELEAAARDGKFLHVYAVLQGQRDRLLAALRECDEAMAYMSEYDIPIGLPDRVKAAIAAVEDKR